jgi:orotate phosphoribosyltransferase
VVLVEDLVSTGGSSVRCVEALRHEDATVAAVVALFSYGLPQAAEAFAKAGLPLQVLATFDELLEAARARRDLEEEDLASLDAWRQDPTGWSRGHDGKEGRA